jgi:hypothetical protein
MNRMPDDVMELICRSLTDAELGMRLSLASPRFRSAAIAEVRRRYDELVPRYADGRLDVRKMNQAAAGRAVALTDARGRHDREANDSAGSPRR